MRTLGILGGMSWESTAEYYRLINRGIAERLGGLHSARLLMHSVDFADVAALQRAGDWQAAAGMLGGAAQRLESIGAAAIVLATNTMHQVRSLVHRVIFDELCVGRIDADSRAQYVVVTERLRDDGAEAVIFGCTEIGLLLRPEHVSLPAFDTTALHAAAAVSFSLGATGLA